MKILLTGGAGFIGSHLAEVFLAAGASVQVIDDLSTGSIENIHHLKGREGFSYVIDTVLNVPLMAELVDEADIVLHLAAAVGVRLIVESPVRTIETNIKGTEVVLNLAAKKKKKVVLFSTSEVYGKSNAGTFSEEGDLILGPTYRGRWSYAASKIIDEFLGLAYFKERGLPVVIIRLFNTVGPRQTGRYGMVVPRFIHQALQGEPITVYGNGRQTRTFTHVKDAVRAIVQLAQHPDAVGAIFNVGGNEEISIGKLAAYIKERLGSASSIVTIPYDEAYEAGFEDMMRRAPDLGRVRQLIGYAPQHTLDDIIDAVAAYERCKLPAARLQPAADVRSGCLP